MAVTAAGGGLNQWEELRRRARQMESDIDSKLIQFNKLSVQTSSGSDNGTSALSTELESLLMQLSETNEHMSRCSRDMGAAEGARLSLMLQRHRELLHEYEREFRKIRANIQEQRERDELLHSVRQDIGEYKSAASARMDNLVRERGAAQNSVRTTDTIIANANATYEALRQQRSLYTTVASRLSVFRSKLPSIDQLLGKITRKRKMDSLILGAVVSTCAIIIIYFSILR